MADDLGQMRSNRRCVGAIYTEVRGMNRMRSLFFPRVAHPPDFAGPVIRYNERALVVHRHAYGSAPNLSVPSHKASHEINVFARGFPILHGNTNNLVADATLAIPRA